jgi:hypothetical protein
MTIPNFDVVNSDVPAEYAATVTPSDTVNFARDCRGLYVGVGGNISLLLINGTTTVFANVPTGSILPVRARRVNSTGTTANSIVALY